MSAEDTTVEPTLLNRLGVGLRLPAILGIFLTVFLDLLSFGLFIPDLQLRGQEMVGKMLGPTADSRQTGLLIGFTLAVFSLAQLVTAPFLGRLSDRVGRRKVLLVTTLLSVASYIVYAHVESWPLIVLSRVLSGIAAANLGVAFAYVADVTKPEDRAKGLGTIGAAFGLGFILGPAAGAFLLRSEHNSPVLLGYVGAALAALNFIYVLLVLPESHKHNPSASGHAVENFRLAFRTPGLAFMLLLFFSVNFAFTNLETTFFRLLADSRSIFHLGPVQARTTGGIILAIVGVVGAFTQGFLVRKLTPRYGEVRVLRVSYLLMAPALVLVPFAPLWVPAVIVIVFLGLGSGLAQPSLSSLISRSAPREIQGGIFGVTQSLGALARCVSPLISNSLFQGSPAYPYLFGAFILIFPAFASWRLTGPAGEE